MFDRFEGAAARECDDRASTRQRFHRRDAEVFFAGQEGGAGAAVEFAQGLGRHVAQKGDIGTREGTEALGVRTGSDDRQWDSQQGGCVNGRFKTFVRHQRGHHQKIRTRPCCSRREKVRVHGRVQDGCLPIIVPRDPARNVRGVGEKAIHARCGATIPTGQGGHDRSRSGMPEPTQPRHPEIRLELVPRVAHGGMAVADVHGPPGGHHGLRRTVARRNHHIHIVEVELFDGDGKQRQVVAIETCGQGQVLDPGGANSPLFDQR